MIRTFALASTGLVCLTLLATSGYAQNVSRQKAWARCVKSANITDPVNTGDGGNTDRVAVVKACLTKYGYPNG